MLNITYAIFVPELQIPSISMTYTDRQVAASKKHCKWPLWPAPVASIPNKAVFFDEADEGGRC